MRLPGLTLLLVLLPQLLLAAVIEGRVVYGDEPLEGVRVEAYATLDFTTTPLAISVESDAEGLYRLELPAGTYALFGWDATRSRFAFSGRNPINLGDENSWVGLQAVEATGRESDAYEDEYSTAVEGVVVNDGIAVENAFVYLYLDVAEDLKGRGYRMSMPTGTDGYFRFDGLPESNYYLVARKRQNGQRVGPVSAGDLFGIFSANPLTARAGEVSRVTVNVVEKVRESSESETFGRTTGPVLSGVVVDEHGQGVAGVHVFAYVDRVIGHQRPAAISSPTAADGQFTVNLPSFGTYYVGAREAYGDSPAPGELFGMYEESADHGLTVEQGQNMENLRIVVEPVAIF